jgi:hypothetical protein
MSIGITSDGRRASGFEQSAGRLPRRHSRSGFSVAQLLSSCFLEAPRELLESRCCFLEAPQELLKSRCCFLEAPRELSKRSWSSRSRLSSRWFACCFSAFLVTPQAPVSVTASTTKRARTAAHSSGEFDRQFRSPKRGSSARDPRCTPRSLPSRASGKRRRRLPKVVRIERIPTQPALDLIPRLARCARDGADVAAVLAQ